MKVHYKGFDAKFEFEPGDVTLVCGCVIDTKRQTVDWSCQIHDEWCADRISDACAEQAAYDDYYSRVAND